MDYRTAVVRSVPSSFVDAIRPAGGAASPIDVDVARAQHDAYVKVLEGSGVRVRRLRADERLPDCCFVEDAAVVIGDIAVVCRMASPSRRGEGVAVERELSRHAYVLRMQAPAFMDGGDVVRVGNRLFVGLSERTNTEAVQQLRYSLGSDYLVTPVEVHGVLHLKSACTHVGGDVLLVDSGSVDPAAFGGYATVAVPPKERYAANCLWVNETVFVSSGYPHTLDLVAGLGERHGFRVVELEMSEFRKAGGSLTCLSILF
jgi:dimethylargininase